MLDGKRNGDSTRVWNVYTIGTHLWILSPVAMRQSKGHKQTKGHIYSHGSHDGGHDDDDGNNKNNLYIVLFKHFFHHDAGHDDDDGNNY